LSVSRRRPSKQIGLLPPASLGDTPAISSNPTVQSLRTRLAELQRQKVQLNERYGPKNPQVIENANAIEDTTKQYQAALLASVESIKNEYETALATERRS
jgi:uncharacterized protein involved in exopolysaccharide biosynthesis